MNCLKRKYSGRYLNFLDIEKIVVGVWKNNDYICHSLIYNKNMTSVATPCLMFSQSQHCLNIKTDITCFKFWEELLIFWNILFWTISINDVLFLQNTFRITEGKISNIWTLSNLNDLRYFRLKFEGWRPLERVCYLIKIEKCVGINKIK